jgi:hypothetical protein
VLVRQVILAWIKEFKSKSLHTWRSRLPPGALHNLDPFICMKFLRTMRIISFIEDGQVIRAILASKLPFKWYRRFFIYGLKAKDSRLIVKSSMEHYKNLLSPLYSLSSRTLPSAFFFINQSLLQHVSVHDSRLLLSGPRVHRAKLYPPEHPPIIQRGHLAPVPMWFV